MKMIEKIMRSMRDTGLLEGMSDEDLDTIATAALEALKDPDSKRMMVDFDNGYFEGFKDVPDADKLSKETAFKCFVCAFNSSIDAALNE